MSGIELRIVRHIQIAGFRVAILRQDCFAIGLNLDASSHVQFVNAIGIAFQVYVLRARRSAWKSGKGRSTHQPGNWVERLRRDLMPGLGGPRPPTDEAFLERLARKSASEFSMPIDKARESGRGFCAAAARAGRRGGPGGRGARRACCPRSLTIWVAS
jgi:hypothetical protein